MRTRLSISALFVLASFACGKSENHPPVLDNNPPVNVGTGTGGTRDGGAGDGGLVGGVLLAATPAPVGGVALDGALLYYGIGGGPPPDVDAGATPTVGSIAVVQRTGGAPVALVRGGTAPSAMLVAQGRLVWLDGGAIFAIDLASPSSVITLASGLDAPSTIATDGTAVFVAQRSAATGVSVDRVAASGGSLANVTTFTGAVTPGGLALDAGNVWLVVDTIGGGQLLRVPSGGGTAEIVWDSPTGTPRDVTVAGGHAWVSVDGGPTDGGSDGGRIVTVPTSGGAPAVALDTQPHPLRVAHDDANVYFTAADGVRRVALGAAAGGTGAATVLASGLDSPAALAIGDAVYVATARGVARVAK